MRTHVKTWMVCLPVAAGLASLAVASGDVQPVLSRMDASAATFKSMTANVTYLTHTEVLNDNSTETGTVTMKKVHEGDVQGKVDFTAPDQKIITIEKRRVQEYFPKINTVQVYDLGKHGAAVDQFLLMGFGTSGSELASGYEVTVTGQDQVQGQSAIRLLLLPKSGDAKQLLTKVEMWIPAQGDPYPLREKIYQPSGDYVLISYTNLKINPPLAPDALALKPPPGVKIEHPGK